MKKLDINSDGQISDVELCNALSTVESLLTKEAIDQSLKKLVSGTDDFGTLKEYSKLLIKRFDSNNDGLISF